MIVELKNTDGEKVKKVLSSHWNTREEKWQAWRNENPCIPLNVG